MTSQYCWLDMGYGHGDPGYFPPSLRWQPHLHKDKIAVIRLRGFKPMGLKELYRQDTASMAGGFIGGHRKAINEFAIFYSNYFNALLHRGIADDDQTVMALIMGEQGRRFDAREGSWFDAIKVFR